jgi:hypothetical protein
MYSFTFNDVRFCMKFYYLTKKFTGKVLNFETLINVEFSSCSSVVFEGSLLEVPEEIYEYQISTRGSQQI